MRSTNPCLTAEGLSLLLLFVVLELTGCRPAETPTGGNTSAPWRDVRRIRGHDDTVADLAFTSDGKQLISAGYDKSVRLWEIGTNRLLRMFGDHEYPVTSVAVNSDGTLVAGGSQEPSVRVWQAADGNLVFPPIGVGRLGDVSGIVAFSPDGKLLATNAPDNLVRLWDLGDGQPARTLQGHSRSILCLAFSPDGEILAAGGSEGIVRLWSVSDGRSLQVLKNHIGGVRTVTFSRDGRMLATGAEGGTLNLCRISDWKRVQELRYGNPVLDIALSPDAGLLAVCSTSDVEPYASLRLWRVADGSEFQVLIDESAQARCVAFSPDGNLLAAGCTDGTIRLFTHH